ncbi:hypothetical protein ACFY6U_00740 [Streptomyces sp. NPDC013157]|uniref:rhamnogalacturonan endolyase family protein n=1 Tax=Streptomyces sp. NPDC013157 TaxID=3364861 RepID=UPI0036D0F017
MAALIAAGLTALSSTSAAAATARRVEALDRGVVSVHTDAWNLVSWRWLGTDPDGVSTPTRPTTPPSATAGSTSSSSGSRRTPP